MTPFGQTLLLWRMERGWTQDRLALKSGISRPNLSAIERGKREVNLRTLRALAAALEVRPGVLADGESPPSRLPRQGFSRSALDRIAECAVSGQRPEDEGERALVLLLREVTKNRLASPERRRILRGARRVTDLAWLRLNAAYPESVVRSLFQRMDDRLAVR